MKRLALLLVLAPASAQTWDGHGHDVLERAYVLDGLLDGARRDDAIPLFRGDRIEIPAVPVPAEPKKKKPK